MLLWYLEKLKFCDKIYEICEIMLFQVTKS